MSRFLLFFAGIFGIFCVALCCGLYLMEGTAIGSSLGSMQGWNLPLKLLLLLCIGIGLAGSYLVDDAEQKPVNSLFLVTVCGGIVFMVLCTLLLNIPAVPHVPLFASDGMRAMLMVLPFLPLWIGALIVKYYHGKEEQTQ